MTGGSLESLSRRTAGGMLWTTGGNLATAGFQIVYTAVMARLLTPTEFGLVAMANVVIGLASQMSRMGVGPALIQRPALSDRLTRTAVTLAFAFGAVGTVAVVAAAPIAGRFYDEPAVIAVATALAFSLLLTGVGLTSEALLRRALRFRRLVAIDLVSYSFGYLGVGILAAVAGAGVWSLVAATLSQGLLKTVALLIAEHRGRRPGWDSAEARSVLAFGTQVTGIGIVQYFGAILPTLVIGRVLGAAPLGQFNRSQLLINLPLEKATSSLSRVLFPALASVNTERARFQNAYQLAVRIAALVVVPTIALAMVLGDLLVELLLGPGWEQAAGILPIVAAASGFAYLTHFPGIALEALGRLRGKLVVELLAGGILLAALLVFVPAGLAAAAYAILVVEGLRFAAMQGLLGAAFTIPAHRMLEPFGPGAMAGVVTAPVAFLSKSALPIDHPAILLVAVVSVTMLATVSMFFHHSFRELAAELRRRLAAGATNR
jgi:lipopolysaccharide exporter